ncbi:ABC transporter ATP-binding protein [Streptococcus pneumoniae]|nr:ABC transporter ATP-binding protein [Streptococcus pneumoniae]
MLRLTHVTLKTRQVILQDADFTFKKGRVLVFLLSMARERRHYSEL